MLFLNDGFIHSESLDERLKPVYEKRGDLKRKSEQQPRVNGKFVNNNTAVDGVSAPESTQTKRKETKLNKTINIPFDSFWDLYDKKTGEKGKLSEKWNKLSDLERTEIMRYIPNYKICQPDKKFRKDPQTFLNNKSWNDELIGSIEIPKQQIYKNDDFEAYKKRQQELGKTLN
jgi:hypothetical protein